MQKQFARSSVFIAFFVAAILNFIPRFAQAQPVALAELFRNVACQNCQAADDTFAVYMSKHPGIELINYHNNSPLASDTFYLASLPGSLDRNTFYNPTGDPDGVIDGLVATSGAPNEVLWEQYSDEALQHQFASTISIKPIGVGPSGIDTFHFVINGSGNAEVSYYVAIKESQLIYNNPFAYGKPPGNIWNDVFRTMLPTGNGSARFGLGGTHTIDTIIYDPSQYNYYGNPQNMVAVIFVQDVTPLTVGNGYQVEALDTISLASTAGVSESTTPSSNNLIISPSIFQGTGRIICDLANGGNAQLIMRDMLGREVMNLFTGALPAGQTTVEMNSLHLPAGCYFVELSLDGTVVDNQKFIVVP